MKNNGIPTTRKLATVDEIKTLKGLTAKYRDAYAAAHERSRNIQLASLKPGQVAPYDRGRIEDAGIRENVEKEIQGIRAEGLRILDGFKKDIKDARAATPSTDAVNYCSMLSLKRNVSKEEINDALDKYGDTYIVRSTLRDLALKHDIRDFMFDPDPVDLATKAIDSIQVTFNRFSVTNAENGGAGAGLIAMVNMGIDDIDSLYTS